MKNKFWTDQTRLIQTIGISISLIVLSSLCGSVFAVEKIRQEKAEKIHINADHMKLNIGTGNSTYTGNVKISQGKLLLTGQTVSIVQNTERVERIKINGNPATYTRITKTGKTIHATSQQMVYTESNHRLVLTGNAQLSQPERTIKSQRIVYDTQLGTVVAGNQSRETGNAVRPTPANERVNITLTPKEKTTEKIP